MDPVQTVKSNLTVGKIVGWTITAIAVLAIADAAGLTPWVIQPVTTAKAKLAKR
jgi:hypothetical protein